MEEALLKKLVHYSSGSTLSSTSASHSCQTVLTDTQSRIEDCTQEIEREMRKAYVMLAALHKHEPGIEFEKEPFACWIKNVRQNRGNGNCGDPEVASVLLKMVTKQNIRSLNHKNPCSLQKRHRG